MPVTSSTGSSRIAASLVSDSSSSTADPCLSGVTGDARTAASHRCARARAKGGSGVKKRYAARAGVEGTFSQADRVVGLRRTRYIGLAKTHLQHVVTAAATTVLRLVAWFEEVPRGFTRRSALARPALTRV
ncbi:MAG TPA: transposase [Vicinamibacterales bacterium]